MTVAGECKSENPIRVCPAAEAEETDSPETKYSNIPEPAHGKKETNEQIYIMIY